MRMSNYENAIKLAGAEIHCFKEFSSYQGDWLAKVTYQGKTGWIKGSYGSCSGCDAYEAEFGYDDPSDDKAAAFGKQYLEEFSDYKNLLNEYKEQSEWDTESEDIIKFLIEHGE